jgi:hypothetical protein
MSLCQLASATPDPGAPAPLLASALPAGATAPLAPSSPGTAIGADAPPDAAGRGGDAGTRAGPDAERVRRARENGARSRGPVTAAGKARASRNALQHGLTAKVHLVLDGEDEAAFSSLALDLFTELSPAGTLDGFLVAQLTAALWKTGRAERLEAQAFAKGPVPDADRLRLALRYQGHNRLTLFRCLRELKDLRREPLLALPPDPAPAAAPPFTVADPAAPPSATGPCPPDDRSTAHTVAAGSAPAGLPPPSPPAGEDAPHPPHDRAPVARSPDPDPTAASVPPAAAEPDPPHRTRHAGASRTGSRAGDTTGPDGLSPSRQAARCSSAPPADGPSVASTLPPSAGSGPAGDGGGSVPARPPAPDEAPPAASGTDADATRALRVPDDPAPAPDPLATALVAWGGLRPPPIPRGCLMLRPVRGIAPLHWRHFQDRAFPGDEPLPVDATGRVHAPPERLREFGLVPAPALASEPSPAHLPPPRAACATTDLDLRHGLTLTDLSSTNSPGEPAPRGPSAQGQNPGPSDEAPAEARPPTPPARAETPNEPSAATEHIIRPAGSAAAPTPAAAAAGAVPVPEATAKHAAAHPPEPSPAPDLWSRIWGMASPAPTAAAAPPTISPRPERTPCDAADPRAGIPASPAPPPVAAAPVRDGAGAAAARPGSPAQDGRRSARHRPTHRLQRFTPAGQGHARPPASGDDAMPDDLSSPDTRQDASHPTDHCSSGSDGTIQATSMSG